MDSNLWAYFFLDYSKYCYYLCDVRVDMNRASRQNEQMVYLGFEMCG